MDSIGHVYVALDEKEPTLGEPILIVPISVTGLPEWTRCTVGIIGEFPSKDITRDGRLSWRHGGVVVRKYRFESALGRVDAPHAAFPLRSVLFVEVANMHRGELWVGMAQRAADSATQARELAQVKGDWSAALAENRGLRKRLKIEREVVRGLFKGLVNPKTAERLTADLDVLVGKSDAPTASDGGVRGGATEHPVHADTVAAIEKVAVSLEQGRRETPDVRDMVLANGATHLRMVAAGLAKRVDPRPAAAPAKVAADPELIRNVQRAWDTVRDVIMHRNHWSDAFTRSHLDEASQNLELAIARLQGGLPGVSVAPTAAPAQHGLDPEVRGEIDTILGLLSTHVVSPDRIEKTEEVIGNAATRLRAVLEKLRASDVSSNDDLARTQQL